MSLNNILNHFANFLLFASNTQERHGGNEQPAALSPSCPVPPVPSTDPPRQTHTSTSTAITLSPSEWDCVQLCDSTQWCVRKCKYLCSIACDWAYESVTVLNCECEWIVHYGPVREPVCPCDSGRDGVCESQCECVLVPMAACA